MKMREALEYVLHFDATDETAMDDGLTEAERIMEYADHIEECQKKARAALSAPARNCDVGTADEQAERFENFCLKHIGCAEETGGRHCVGCPLEKASRNITQKCELYWAQMPYEANEGTVK